LSNVIGELANSRHQAEVVQACRSQSDYHLAQASECLSRDLSRLVQYLGSLCRIATEDATRSTQLHDYCAELLACIIMQLQRQATPLLLLDSEHLLQQMATDFFLPLQFFQKTSVLHGQADLAANGRE
jgi:hypothetical protein